VTIPLVAKAPISTTESISPQPGAVIKYSTLGAYFLSFTLGIVVVLIGQNFVSGTTSSFSTASLISFLFGIALSAASIVLAIAAISLGKSSERVMIERSDASIRLQNEVFTKTTEALARIESSTGVTEKRIEDIISGRAGELSHAIAERIDENSGGRGKNREVLEREIKESLIDELSASRALQLQQRDEARKRKEVANLKYRKFQKELLVAISASGAGTCEKLGDGRFGGEGEELFDAVIRVGNARVGVSAFSTEPGLATSHLRDLASFLQAAVREIAAKHMDRILIALDGEDAPENRYHAKLAEILAVLKPEIADNVRLLDGASNGAIAKVTEWLKGLVSNSASGLQLIGGQGSTAKEAPASA